MFSLYLMVFLFDFAFSFWSYVVIQFTTEVVSARQPGLKSRNVYLSCFLKHLANVTNARLGGDICVEHLGLRHLSWHYF